MKGLPVSDSNVLLKIWSACLWACYSVVIRDTIFASKRMHVAAGSTVEDDPSHSRQSHLCAENDELMCRHIYLQESIYIIVLHRLALSCRRLAGQRRYRVKGVVPWSSTVRRGCCLLVFYPQLSSRTVRQASWVWLMARPTCRLGQQHGSCTCNIQSVSSDRRQHPAPAGQQHQRPERQQRHRLGQQHGSCTCNIQSVSSDRRQHPAPAGQQH